jgi:hypothetical protein
VTPFAGNWLEALETPCNSSTLRERDVLQETK